MMMITIDVMGHSGLALAVLFLACFGLAAMAALAIAFVREYRIAERERRRYEQLMRIQREGGLMK